MKRKVLTVLLLVLSLCMLAMLSSCGLGHTHKYDQKNTAWKYAYKDATCDQPDEYYYSCTCGKMGTKTFKHGEGLGHYYNSYAPNENGTHFKVCLRDNSHTLIENCSGGQATCTEKAICEYCHERYGDTNDDNHQFNQTNTQDEFLFKPATCDDSAEYYYSCACGLKANTTFKYGSKLGHKWETYQGNGDDTHTKICSNDASHTIIENCSGGQATCTEKATCKNCNQYYGDFKHNYWHSGYNETEHYLECSCGAKTDIETHNHSRLTTDSQYHWYQCTCGHKDGLGEHEGGTASCTAKAICTVCNTSYGSLEKHDYSILKKDSTYHWLECYCGAKLSNSLHYGGTGTCQELDVCAYCQTPYGQLKECSYVNNYCEWCNEKRPDSVGLKYESSGSYYIVAGRGTCTDADIVIPSTYNGIRVGGIKTKAFQNDKTLVSIEIPSTVSFVGERAFYNCSKLTDAILKDGLAGIYSQAFCSCDNLTSITIPESVEFIEMGAFSNCHMLSEINFNAINCADYTYILSDIFDGAGTSSSSLVLNIGNKVTKIPSRMFNQAKGITKVVFEENSVCQSIGDVAFRNCTKLREVNFPSSLKSIGDQSFYDCDQLREAKLLNGLLYIYNQAFCSCDNLTSVTIPESVILIEYSAFSNCKMLSSIKYNAINCADHSDIFADIFDGSGTGVSSLTLTIGNKVKKIPIKMFKNAEGITQVVFERNSVCEKISDEAFRGCERLSLIVYNGTKAAWGKIDLNYRWAYNTSVTYVRCDDGSVSI